MSLNARQASGARAQTCGTLLLSERLTLGFYLAAAEQAGEILALPSRELRREVGTYG